MDKYGYYNVIELKDGKKFTYFIHDDIKQQHFEEALIYRNHMGNNHFHVNIKGYGNTLYSWDDINRYEVFDGKEKYLEAYPNNDLDITE